MMLIYFMATMNSSIGAFLKDSHRNSVINARPAKSFHEIKELLPAF